MLERGDRGHWDAVTVAVWASWAKKPGRCVPGGRDVPKKDTLVSIYSRMVNAGQG
jgi:hypothetical protein